jgi:peptide/nickel transport system substrate-binding protein
VPSSPSRRTVLTTGAALLALSVTSCTGAPAPSPSPTSPAPSATAEPTATFNFGTAVQPLGLDPALSSDVESQRITRQILEGLVGVDQTTGKPTPLLATEWSESNEGRSYTFKLRSGVTFHDGSPFNADAVCTNFNRWFAFSEDLRRQAPGSSFKGVFKAHSDQPELSIFKSCTALAADTVRIDLTQRFTAFLQALTLPAFAIASPAALAAGKADVLDQKPRRPGDVRLRHQSGGHRSLHPEVLGRRQCHPGRQRGVLGRPRPDRHHQLRGVQPPPGPPPGPAGRQRSTATTP